MGVVSHYILPPTPRNFFLNGIFAGPFVLLPSCFVCLLQHYPQQISFFKNGIHITTTVYTHKWHGDYIYMKIAVRSKPLGVVLRIYGTNYLHLIL